ncbi:MAG: PKD domain-containing protein [Methylococcales bacterium]|nr:PKD domain-containing protein [Methylococcales bacterium]
MWNYPNYSLPGLFIMAWALIAMPIAVAANKPPIATIAKIVAVNEGALVTLDGSSSTDKDGAIAKYAWAQNKGPTVALTAADTAKPSFTAPLIVKTTAPTKTITLGFKLTVTDQQNAVGSKTVLLTVKPVNALPVARAGSDMTVGLSKLVTLDGSHSTDDGKLIAYAWRQTKGKKVALKNANKAQATFTSAKVNEELEFQLTVTDNDKKTAKDTVLVKVSDAPPVLSANFSLDKTSLLIGDTATAGISAITGGVAPYTIKFDWGDGSAVEQIALASGVTAKSASHNYLSAGSFTLNMTVTDAKGITKSQASVLSVAQPPVPLAADFTLNSTAVLVGDQVLATAKAIVGGTGTYKVKFEWGDGTAAQEFALAAGITSQSAPHNYAANGEFSLKITVSDANNGIKTFTVPISVQLAEPLGEC